MQICLACCPSSCRAGYHVAGDRDEGAPPAQPQAQSAVGRAQSILKALSIKKEQHLLTFDVVESTKYFRTGKVRAIYLVETKAQFLTDLPAPADHGWQAASVCHDLLLLTDLGGVKGKRVQGQTCSVGTA